ncbi:hypothetical protein CWR48_01260 [Oceanobacillus arenosus]|uniref:Transcriptional regulator n=1 Tax=Oceanobacillus arenosus TaxID=1229153 RepID=A0A3D8Q2A5_9BACI|nr:hypothetical protein [Oceanobacillus arenosus]RDW22363.1 hypothetical protein CWR48_01260 [Oceanobacillus arenosus]
MRIKIAMFGRSETIMRAKAIIGDNPNISLLPFIYEEEMEVLELIERAFLCDIYIFTEPISYLYVKEKIEKKRLPVVQVALDEHTLLASVYQLIQQCQQVVNRFSVDVIEGANIIPVLRELNIHREHVFHYSYLRDVVVDLDEIIEHHTHLWNEGKIDHVITSSKEVEYRLYLLNIPASLMRIPSKNIEQAIMKAASMINFKQTTSAQVVVGYASLKSPPVGLAIQDEHVLQITQDKIQAALTLFAKNTNAAVFAISGNQFAIVGTKNLLDYLTSHYRDFPLFHELTNQLQLPVDIGFGLGLSPEEAEENAQLALNACSLEEKSISYIINERKELIGPIGVKKHVDTSKLYQALIHKARLNNELSYNFIEFITNRNNEPFSSNDIAVFYNVTKRSAERTVNKLLSGEVIRVSGEERPYLKGRPRKLFTLNQ